MSVGEAAVPKLATNSMVATNHRSFALTIFLSAFLLFQVQLIVGKQLLPWFGGTPAVWNTCLVFFQLLLLAGYAYAHVSIRFLKPRVQMFVHVALLLGSGGAVGAAERFDTPRQSDRELHWMAGAAPSPHSWARPVCSQG